MDQKCDIQYCIFTLVTFALTCSKTLLFSFSMRGYLGMFLHFNSHHYTAKYIQLSTDGLTEEKIHRLKKLGLSSLMSPD